MDPLAPFTISFSGLKEGFHEFDFSIHNTFFEAFDYHEFNETQLIASIILNKKSTLLEVHFALSGHVNINCDVTTEPFDLPINTQFDLVIKFGESYDNEQDALLILPYGSYQFDTAHYLYETLVLSLPQKRVHPGVIDGSLTSEVIQQLEKLQPKTQQSFDDDIDPRWNALKKLKP